MLIADWIVDETGGGDIARAVMDDTSPTRVVISADASEEFVTLGPDRLVGVLTRPIEAANDQGRLLVLLNSGSDPHTGPGRAWVELASGRGEPGLVHAPPRLERLGRESRRPVGPRTAVWTSYAERDRDVDRRSARSRFRHRGVGRACGPEPGSGWR